MRVGSGPSMKLTLDESSKMTFQFALSDKSKLIIQYFKEDDHGCPIYKRKGLTSRKQEVYLYRIHGNNKWRIGPVFHGSGAVNCWLYIISDGKLVKQDLIYDLSQYQMRYQFF